MYLKWLFLIDFLETIIMENSSQNRGYTEKQTTYRLSESGKYTR